MAEKYRHVIYLVDQFDYEIVVRLKRWFDCHSANHEYKYAASGASQVSGLKGDGSQSVIPIDYDLDRRRDAIDLWSWYRTHHARFLMPGIPLDRFEQSQVTRQPVATSLRNFLWAFVQLTSKRRVGAIGVGVADLCEAGASIVGLPIGFMIGETVAVATTSTLTKALVEDFGAVPVDDAVVPPRSSTPRRTVTARGVDDTEDLIADGLIGDLRDNRVALLLSTLGLGAIGGIVSVQVARWLGAW